MVRSLLPVIDNFDMAMAAAEALKDPSAQSLKMGIDMVRNQLRGVLTEYGVEEVDAVGKTFDPNLHEAVSQMESAEVAEGNVLQQLRKGYRMRERLIRPASVIVAKSPAQPAQE
jgi:molecular chaperone GrpE